MKKLFFLLSFICLVTSFKAQAVQNALVSGYTANITNTDTTLVISASASRRIKVTSLTITNGSSSQGTWVNVISKNVRIFTVYATAQGGATINFSQESPLQLQTNNALRVVCETSGAEIRVSAVGYTGL